MLFAAGDVLTDVIITLFDGAAGLGCTTNLVIAPVAIAVVTLVGAFAVPSTRTEAVLKHGRFEIVKYGESAFGVAVFVHSKRKLLPT